jgi:dipeptidyl aminopeptidase/acylaminoacyl peptidase
VRPLNSAKARVVDDIDVEGISWSPDSQHIAYRHSSSLKTLDARTFTSRIVDRQIGPNLFGSSWTHDGQILLGLSFSPIMKVPMSGGERTPLFQSNRQAGNVEHTDPEVLSDSEHVLFRMLRRGALRNDIYLARLDGKGEAKRIYADAQARYLRPHTLLIYENGGLSLVEFDLESGKTGEPKPLAGEYSGLANFAISASGSMLAYVKTDADGEQITLYDRGGKKLQTIASARPSLFAHLELSPDGKRLLFERDTGDSRDLWTMELGRNVVSRLTFHEESEEPGIWSSDGQRVYFYSDRKVDPGIYEIPANGSGKEKLLLKAQTHHLHASLDGKQLLFERGSYSTALDILDLETGKVSEYSPSRGSHPQFSPDSRYVAYDSEETGRTEVYVQTNPAGKGKWQISANGGRQSRWRGDGKEIYYLNEGKVMAAAIEIRDGSLEVTSSKELFAFRHSGFPGKAMAVSADGKVFAIREGSGVSSPIMVKLNLKLPGR